MKLLEVVEQLIEERDLDRATLERIICDGIVSAFEKKYPDLEFRAEYDKPEDRVVVFVKKTVMAHVEDELREISLRKAHFLNKKAAEGDSIWVEFGEPIGRKEIVRAKQTISEQIRKVEADAIYKEFKPREGEIVYGTVHKCERNGVTVKLHDNLAFLPKSLTLQGDVYNIGSPLRAILKEVLEEPRGDNQLILDRTSEEFILKLFELEIPEIFEHIVEIKKIVRAPGYKSKIAVISNDPNIDPVGTCIGVGGVRIKPILKELGQERIDVMGWPDSLEERIHGAMKPAKISGLKIQEDGSIDVYIEPDQRSVAIGRMGKNIMLASQMVGASINLVCQDTSPKSEMPFMHQDEEAEDSPKDESEAVLDKNDSEKD